ncbi:hypothetical protein ATE69_19105 [Sphingopyxis sp. H071]|nr:hypothetical protein ATE61_18955 [Sphingopyxis sp. H057]KTE49909.1 hypothetical protein ATE69_19105 [Sphingopyxis sp. H071]KTE51195.1 hypothetical protein ATE64_15075 [Sphingopyxis sp. H073]KTE56447.1 hypothetical protein ATE66_19385 [Sphingopyxis sp. H107]KTE60151.1 hypothetical protein ATE65_19720 [Sphingopyxis sp. H100]KTE66743.1 hypothetical protein ATE60_19860 [Sphingopyxis sp. H081]KTE75855.1 hypothetical protein ATE63_20455 [Sphingopyxis sp. H067]
MNIPVGTSATAMSLRSSASGRTRAAPCQAAADEDQLNHCRLRIKRGNIGGRQAPVLPGRAPE